MRFGIFSPRGANSALGRRRLRETVATGTGSPRDPSSRTAAACGRKRSQACTGNHACTETPGGERSTGRGGGSAIASHASSQSQSGRQRLRSSSRRYASIRIPIVSLGSEPCDWQALPHCGQAHSSYGGSALSVSTGRCE